MTIDRHIENAARDAAAAYDVNGPSGSQVIRVEQFRPLSGLLCAAVKIDPEGKRASVAFRGTHPRGNWVFTNFQAYFSQLKVVDESLTSATALQLQGGAYRIPFLGAVHQGFARAFSWLWYGTDSLPGALTSDAADARQRVYRHTALLGVLVCLWLFGCLSLNAVLLLFSGISLFMIGLERGTWEDLFRQRPQMQGRPLRDLLKDLNCHEAVVFTGHSLGGALASIAFAVYRVWCSSAADRRDNGWLVTFGAPRVGDNAFVKEFESVHAGRYIHIVHPGDPVPEMPPMRLADLITRRFWQRGVLGVLVLMLAAVWELYAACYRVARPGQWTSVRVLAAERTAVPVGSLDIKLHNMTTSYLAGLTRG